MHDKANVALVLEQAYMGQLQTLNQRLAAARSTISELEAERDEARNRNASVELEAVGYSNRMHDALARAEAAEQALTSERQRREELEAIARPLAQGWRSYGNAEAGQLELLRGTLGIWHFKDAAEHFCNYEPGK